MIVQSKLIPKGICVNLFGTYWARDTSWIDKYVVNHESIHTAQQRELLFIGFYIFYLIEWVIRYFQYGNWHKAYLNISFEREAYANGYNLKYLQRRKHFAQWRQ